MSDTTVLDWVTALGTLGAVVVAVWATVGSQRAIRRQLEVGALVTRRREAMELLQAFEAMQTFRRRDDGSSRRHAAVAAVASASDELLLAQASYAALLRVSEEDLPIAYGMTFGHTSARNTGDLGNAHLDLAPQLGDPEAETTEVMKVRAEIVDAVEALNERIQQAARRRRVTIR